MKFASYEISKRYSSEHHIHFYLAKDISSSQLFLLRVIHPTTENGDFDLTANKWYELYDEYQQNVTNFKHLPRVHTIDTDEDGSVFAVLEYKAGAPLTEAPTIKLTVQQMEEVLDAIWHLHKKGLSHGHISPQTVWVTDQDHVMIFGANEWKSYTTDNACSQQLDIAQLVTLFQDYGELDESKKALLAQEEFHSITAIREFLQSPVQPGLIEKPVIGENKQPTKETKQQTVLPPTTEEYVPVPIPSTKSNKKRYWIIGSVIAAVILAIILSQNLPEKPTEIVSSTPPEITVDSVPFLVKGTEFTYKGEIKNGVPHGNGKVLDLNGNVIFEGQFENGSLHGEGSEYSSDGKLIYEGQYHNGLRNGLGKLYSDVDQRIIYEGSFQNDMQSGLGKSYENGKLVYDGEFATGLPNGEGKFYSEDGTLLYDGQVQNGETKGFGTIFSADGSKYYEGQVKEGYLREGNGITFDPDGSILHKGEYVNDQYSGNGELYSNGVILYTGQFKEGKMNGTGKLFFEDGQVQYDGEFVMDVPHGTGTLYDNNGSLLFDGAFVNGEPKEEQTSKPVASTSNSNESTKQQSTSSSSKNSSLVTLAENNDIAGVQELLENGVDPNSTGSNRNTALISATVNSNYDMMELLLQYGANPNQANADGRVPIMFSSIWGDAYGVQLLLNYGANPNLKDNDGSTALQEAIEQDRTEVIEVLRAVNADPGNPRN